MIRTKSVPMNDLVELDSLRRQKDKLEIVSFSADWKRSLMTVFSSLKRIADYIHFYGGGIFLNFLNV